MSAESSHATEHQNRNHSKVDDDDDPVPPMLARSLEAFRRDLPQLLRTHRGKWVAHHGDQQISVARTAAALYKTCYRRGLKDDQFLVSHISPEIPDDEITWSSDE